MLVHQALSDNCGCMQIKSPNILLSNEGRAKIADTGLALCLDPTHMTLSKMRYAAPSLPAELRVSRLRC